VALGVGSAEARARFGGLSGSVSVTTTPTGIQSVSIQSFPSAVPAGVQLQLRAIASYPDGVQLDVTARTVWTSLSPNVASLANGPNGGVLSAQAPGAAQLTAMFEGREATASVNVTSAVLSGLTILPNSPSSPVGVALPLEARGNFSDGSHFDLTQQARWSSADTALVAVSNSPESRGVAMALVPGTSSVLASVTTPDSTVVNGSVSFVSSPAAVVGIDILPASVILSLSGNPSLSLRATAQLSDGTTRDASTEVSWSVGSGGFAEITASGQLTALKTGDTTVFAGLDTVVGSAPVTINP
jgi:hypothetical protein